LSLDISRVELWASEIEFDPVEGNETVDSK
jgi:hypothetical protein